MKTTVLSLIAICILFIGCKKENPNLEQDDQIIVGGVYHDYTRVIENPCDIKINISEKSYSFNKSEAIYSSHQPTSNQNVFMIYLSDTTSNNKICLDIFTPVIKPEDFFTKSTFKTDTIRISWLGTREDFFDANAVFKWDTATFDNISFKGKASLEITKKIVGTINSDTYYPLQKLDFEFE